MEDLLEARPRFAALDNLKALLIALVVLGHLLEPLVGIGWCKAAYLTIYSFHMPLFALCSGYFSRARGALPGLLRGVVWPYLVFQTAYLCFDCWMGREVVWSWLKQPDWILWYLMALLWWRLALCLVGRLPGWAQWLAVPAAFCVGLWAGTAPSIGYDFALSRTLVLFPFFLLGHNLGRLGAERWRGPLRRPAALLLTGGAALLLLGAIVRWAPVTVPTWTFGTVCYGEAGGSLLFRGGWYLGALVWAAFLLAAMPDRRISVTVLGEQSMAVYLLHGFAVRYLTGRGMVTSPWFALGMAALLWAACSNEWVCRMVRPLLRFPRGRRGTGGKKGDGRPDGAADGGVCVPDVRPE